MIKLRAGRLALCLAALAALMAALAGTALSAPDASPTPVSTPSTTPAFGGETTPELSNKVTFIGDSVTAGFGYCGYSEQAKNTTKCRTNQEMENDWISGDNSLSDCKPPEGTPTDACSNNNDKGKPWDSC